MFEKKHGQTQKNYETMKRGLEMKPKELVGVAVDEDLAKILLESYDHHWIRVSYSEPRTNRLKMREGPVSSAFVEWFFKYATECDIEGTQKEVVIREFIELPKGVNTKFAGW